MSKFSKRLRDLLDENLMEGKDFAKEMNVAQPTVSNWLNDKRTPNQDMLIAIADHFEVSTDYLLGRTNIKKEMSDLDLLLAINEDEADYITKSPQTAAAHAVSELTAEETIEILNYIDYVKSKRKEKSNEVKDADG